MYVSALRSCVVTACWSRTSRNVMSDSVFGWTCRRETVTLTGTHTPSWLVRSRKPSWPWKDMVCWPARRRFSLPPAPLPP